jgi:hypothetical protein
MAQPLRADGPRPDQVCWKSATNQAELLPIGRRRGRWQPHRGL